MTPSKLYLLGPIPDFLVMGLGSILLLLPFAFFQNPTFDGRILELSILLLWVGNWPHFSATLGRLYGSKENRSQYPATTYVIPLVVFVFVGISLREPAQFGSWLVKIYSLWAPYHFCGQSLGLVLLYLRRAEVKISPLERRWLSYFVFASFFFLVFRGESIPWTQKMYGISFSSLEVPRVFAKLGLAWLVLSGSVFYFFHLKAAKERAKFFPAIAYVPLASQLLWFTVGTKILSFDQLVPFFHSIQYLPVVWLLHVKTHPEPGLKSTLGWMRTHFIGGAFLFWACPILLAMLGFAYEITRPIIFAAINVHHFWIDGIVWKLRNPKVSSPLLGGLWEFRRGNPIKQKSIVPLSP